MLLQKDEINKDADWSQQILDSWAKYITEKQQ